MRNLLFACHPEEAEPHAKRATPDEGPMQLACGRQKIGKRPVCPRILPGCFHSLDRQEDKVEVGFARVGRTPLSDAFDFDFASDPNREVHGLSAAEGRLDQQSDVIPNRAESPVRNLLWICVCHPEEAEPHAKRATPDEGPMQLACGRQKIGERPVCPRILPGYFHNLDLQNPRPSGAWTGHPELF